MASNKWILEANSELQELAQSHQAALLRNISKRKLGLNEIDPPEQPNKKVRKPRAKADPAQKPKSKPKEPRLKPASKTRGGSSGRTGATYRFDLKKLPGLISRAEELVKKWNEPKPSKSSPEAANQKLRSLCHNYTILHSKGDVSSVKPKSPQFMAMEFRKSLIRHDWSGVKKLLKVLLASTNVYDRLSWQMLVTVLMYYPGGEPILQEFIERNKRSYSTSDIMQGLLTINRMENIELQLRGSAGAKVGTEDLSSAEDDPEEADSD